MLITQASIIANVSPEIIWKEYTNVISWCKWDKDINYSRLNGEFEVGTQGILKPSSGPTVKFSLSEVTAGKSFTTISHLPLTKLIFIHTLSATDDNKTKIIHTIEMKGIFSPLFAFIIGGNIKKGLPQALHNLAKIVEAK